MAGQLLFVVFINDDDLYNQCRARANQIPQDAP